MSNADRQKAYRDRKRNAILTESEPKRNAQAADSVTRVTPDRNVTRVGPLSPTFQAIGGAALRPDPHVGCSDVGVMRALHAAYSQDTERNASLTIDPVLDKMYRDAAAQVGLELTDTRVGPDVYYHPRTHPERINWGARMTGDQLEGAGLTANRVSIPGDYDYEGVYQC